MQTRTVKICLVGDMLSGGGAERAHATLSNYFSGKGIEVHNVIVQDVVSYHYSGELLNLGREKDNRNGFFNKARRFHLLRSYIKKHSFNYIIDFRMRKKPLQDWLIDKLVFTVPTIYTVHSSKLEWYMPRQTWAVRSIYRNSRGVIAITNKMADYIIKRHGLKNVHTIYNSIDVAYIQKRAHETLEKPDYPYIVAAGRMSLDNVKQFDLLIEAYAASVLPSRNVRLMILGEGLRKPVLERLSIEKGISDKVVFMGFCENPYFYMHNALFYVLSSRFEGMPVVILESLACGTPVIAFDCFTGPSEIIDDQQNGLLIEAQNTGKLTEGMNLMLADYKLYNRCKVNAAPSIEKFSIENIGKKWLEYLNLTDNGNTDNRHT